MPRKHNRTPVPCHHCGSKETQMCYASLEDRHFVACMACGLYGRWCPSEGKAKEAWTKKLDLTMPAVR